MKKVQFNLCNEIRNYFNITPYLPILEWAKKYIDFSSDTGSQRNNFDINLTPHLRQILQATQFKNKIKEITVCGIEQHRKNFN